MKHGIWTIFLTGFLAVWMEQGHFCKAHGARTRPSHKHNELAEAEPSAVAPSSRPPSKNGTVFRDALTEQRYYLLQLFRHYGENGKLSFDGLHKLLASLGLGEVQVVEIEHEDLGHAHVSHLDVLDLQEHKHVHSHTSMDHISMSTKEGKAHSVGPHHSKLLSGSSTTSSTLRSPQGTKGKTTLSPAGRRDAPGDPRRASRGGEGRQRRGTAERGTESARGRRHAKKSHGASAKDNIFNHSKDNILNHSKSNHLHGNCLNVTQLLVNFGMGNVHEITPKQFTYICPALLYQIDSRVCIHHHDWLEDKQEDTISKSVWGWGFVAITLISLTSLMAVAIIPFLSRSFSTVLLTFLVALAVGTLSADALLHLIPHAQDNQDHSHKNVENADIHTLLDGKDAIWKGLAVLGGIYLLFLIENLLALIRKCRGGRPTGKRCQRLYMEKDLASVQVDDRADLELSRLNPARGSDDLAHKEDNWEVMLHGFEQTVSANIPEQGQEEAAVASREPCTQETDEGPESGHTAHSHGHFHGHSHAVEDINNAGISDIAWMVIMGDGVHNFTDGLAIGAAFSTGIPGGLSTTIAVFCHELPHELGDFAVLVRAGLSVRRAVTFNLVSALFSYLGMVVGIAVGQYTNHVTPWIFAGTAGMFLYVALVDMLPEMLRGQSDTKRQCCLGHFMSQNLGFLLGVGIMLCVALFEDQILIDVGF
uniref:zinc transporter ZIP10-like n=1 Tax=Pristiophorus japonicus TaxID=55135 RepID=UPI00398EE032